VGSLNHLEDGLAVSDVDGSTTQLFVEGRVVEQVQVLKHEQACRLEIRMQCQHGAQFVERIAIHPFWVIDEFRYFHITSLLLLH
jgi:hypothetical protein